MAPTDRHNTNANQGLTPQTRSKTGIEIEGVEYRRPQPQYDPNSFTTHHLFALVVLYIIR